MFLYCGIRLVLEENYILALSQVEPSRNIFKILFLPFTALIYKKTFKRKLWQDIFYVILERIILLKNPTKQSCSTPP
jgi:hypothetical protein